MAWLRGPVAATPPGGGPVRRWRSRIVPATVFLVLTLPVCRVFAQDGRISGVVVAEGSERPVGDAQVHVVGTPKTAMTDGNGHFQITGLSSGEVMLRTVRVGFRPDSQTVLVGTTAHIQLVEVAVPLDQLVVTGTPGANAKRTLGNSIATIDASALVDTHPIDDVSDLLDARAPGVVLQQQQGAAGSGARILIRGRGSLSLGSDPLIYIDGVRVNNSMSTGPQSGGDGTNFISRIDDIDPNDIESVEIIKGPAAATLYGTEASNGVIQIITKHGRRGTRRIDVQVRQGSSFLADPRGAIGTSYGFDTTTNHVVTVNPIDVMRDRGTPYFRAGSLYGYTLGLAGGGDQTQYYLSGNSDQIQGVIPTNDDRKTRGRFDLTMQPGAHVTITTDLGLTSSHTDSYSWQYFESGRYFLPGLTNTPVDGFDFGIPPDVLSQTQEFYQQANHLTASVQFLHDPVFWFSDRLTAGIDLTQERNTWLVPLVPDQFAQFYGSQSALGSRVDNNNGTQLLTFDYSATAKYHLGSALQSSTSAGAQLYRRAITTDTLSGQEFPAPGVTSIAAITGPRYAASDYVPNTTVGGYLQQQISWHDRVFVTGAIRGDKNSAFGAAYHFAAYPKVSLSWVPIETTGEGPAAINTLKVRAAYGESGLQPDEFAAARVYTPVPGQGNLPAATPLSIGNPKLGPEVGREMEAGFDAGFLRDRLGVEFTYYDKRTLDAIVQRQVSPSTGFPGIQFVNAGTITNHGIELSLRARPIETRNVSWELIANYSNNSNNIVSLNTPAPYIPVGFIPNRDEAGYPVDSYFGKRVLSAQVNAQGQAFNAMCADGHGGTISCVNAPNVFLAQSQPNTEWSLTSLVGLVGHFQLTTTIDGKIGRSFFNADKTIRCAIDQADAINFSPRRFNPIDVAFCQQVDGIGFFDSPSIGSGNFAKLREVTLSYSAAPALAQHMRAKAMTLSLGARNLYTWRNRGPFDTVDPEVFVGGNFNGSEHNEGAVPLPVQLIGTVRLTF
jgi:TonB-linked SusC/RagA family outer membrane protein